MLKPNLFLSFLLLYSSTSWALESDRKAPIKVDGPTCISKMKENKTICDQGVTITQGSLLIRSAYATIFHKDSQIERIEMTGAPVYFEQQVKDQNDKMVIKSKYMDYRMQEDKVFLKGDVSVTSTMGLTQAQEMEIDLESQEILAGGKEAGQQFHMTIDPNKK